MVRRYFEAALLFVQDELNTGNVGIPYLVGDEVQSLESDAGRTLDKDDLIIDGLVAKYSPNAARNLGKCNLTLS